MKKAYINDLSHDKKMAASEYQVEVIYDDDSVNFFRVPQYSYSDVFEVIKEKHEAENNKGAKRIIIELVR